MGDGSVDIAANNILDDYTYILFNGTERIRGIIFRCTTGLAPTGNLTNNDLGRIYFNNSLLPNDVCNGFMQAQGGSLDAVPGTYNARVCGTFNISSEGVYTCTLRKSNLMDQNVSIGLYFSWRSELFYNV